jgi:hypothetical protein
VETVGSKMWSEGGSIDGALWQLLLEALSLTCWSWCLLQLEQSEAQAVVNAQQSNPYASHFSELLGRSGLGNPSGPSLANLP